MDVDELIENSFENEIKNKNDFNNKIIETRNFIFEKFGNINFIEEGHRYTIEGKDYTPVSNIIKKYEPEVDWDQKAYDYALKYGRKKEDVQIDWKLNNLKSTISGTRTHEFGESYTNLMCGHPELICEQNKPQYLKEFNTLVSTYPKEDAVKKFYEELDKNLHPIGAEFKLSSIYIKDSLPICGTCDILFYDSKNDGFIIGDWKTNKSLIKEYSRNHNITMTGCVNNMIDEPLSHYTIQFNLYQSMLESIGLNIIGRKLIWLKEDGDYEIIEIDKINDNIMKKILKGEN